MKKLIAVMLLTCAGLAQAHGPYNYDIVRVIDGDTVQIEMPVLPMELGDTINLRISGIDAPSTGGYADCPEEALLGKAALDYANSLVFNAQKKQIEIIKWDKYGGRVIGDILLDGKKLSLEMISAGHARVYNGEKKKSWCE